MKPTHNNIKSNSIDNLKQTLNAKQLNHSILYPVSLGVTAMVASTSANAALIVNNNGFDIGQNATVNWDVNSDGLTDILLSDNSTCDNTLYRVDGPINALAPFLYDNNDQLISVTDSTEVGAAGNYENFSCALHDRECNTGTAIYDFVQFTGLTGPEHSSTSHDPDFGGIFGFRFDNNGTINYGLASFNFHSVDGLAPVGYMSINGWVYDDTGASIFGTAANLIGGESVEVSEPSAAIVFGSSLALLAAGATGIRRRRKDQH